MPDQGALLLRNGAQVFTLDVHSIDRRMIGFARSGLARACGLPAGKRILDALGGWGTDAACLASLGHRVTLCEIEPLVYVLCKERIDRLELDIDCLNVSVESFLTETTESFDVIYLDAMFDEHPSGAKSSKPMQVLSDIAYRSEIEPLLRRAQDLATDRVVVKRRRKNRAMLPPPDWTVKGKTVRFDVYRATEL